ncbi:hypothetical protein [Mycobacterium intracellulare]|uniref:hypothetical protein n=1 Tax=Mycobacterium intracellulare TaxID=1767 RepID=UPI0004527859|nr:hypothetical protein [Mycobacterium intracellulare]ETZ33177.1 hypothetical protein L843_3663 [Mycobacterium intracellulare MIN_061107_1834]MCA2273616.1 hypothetical protein [Mycobacterium intracellulare]MCA2325717.1 hypothetical protein [Mycobacterium intracellulare]UEB26549.1 hypothetical protein LK403_10420 [Mycobacterium intracellulare]WVL05519.1 hypothetical protein KN247_25895 [Mycobacterium intracellulare]
MPQLDPQVEQQLADLSDAEWSALSARVRAPDATEMLRTAAAQHLTGAQLDAFVQCADVSKFAGENGEIDAKKVSQHLTALYGAPQASAGQSSEWGRRGGASGREAAAERHGIKAEPKPDAVMPDNGPGAAGRAAAHQRHGQRASGAGAAGREAAQRRFAGKETANDE